MGHRRILRPFRPLICLGARDRLLTQALRRYGVTSSDDRLDVFAKWSFDLRMLASADPDGHPSLGLIADVGTSNVIDIPLSELLGKNFDPMGCYVGGPGEVDDLMGFSRMRLLGRVKRVESATVVLDDVASDAQNDRVVAADVFVEGTAGNRWKAVTRCAFTHRQRTKALGRPTRYSGAVYQRRRQAGKDQNAPSAS